MYENVKDMTWFNFKSVFNMVCALVHEHAKRRKISKNHVTMQHLDANFRH